jgi:hypothetical protein
VFDYPRYMRPYVADLRRRALRAAGLALTALLALVAARAAWADTPGVSRVVTELPVVVLFTLGVLAFAAVERRLARGARRAGTARGRRR